LPGLRAPDDFRADARSFRLRLLEVNPLFARYAVENLSFVAGSAGGLHYRVTGGGIYQVGGEVALQQEMSLQVEIDDGFTTRPASFDSGLVSVSRPWPMIAITLPQTDGTPTRTYTLQVNAAPLREIWFSTLTGFHSGAAPQASNYSQSGRPDLFGWPRGEAQPRTDRPPRRHARGPRPRP
jgi:hypothetical protein